jgi:hypothetical protein
MSKNVGIVLLTQADKDYWNAMRNIQINHELLMYHGTKETMHQDIIEATEDWLEESNI